MIHAAQLPNPYAMDFVQWASIAAEQWARLGVEAPSAEQPWQDWGERLMSNSELGSLPQPFGFLNWKDWAAAVVGSVY